MPTVRAPDAALDAAFRRSIVDLAALRMAVDDTDHARLPAAGVPWFMTIFGRDTVITCLQTLLLGPDLARTALHALAALQATEDDPEVDAEPGKIVHELRRGRAAQTWFPRYYGTVDATPLFLILLSEVWRWTGDDTLVEELRPAAMAALRWIDEYGDRDGDGFVEFARRSPRGLEIQSWKDSWDSQRFANGRIAEPPIAPCEVQGYVFDAKVRLAEMALAVWRDPDLAARLEHDAAVLAKRFDAAFWIPDARCYALALDADKRAVDSICSNIGQLLWSGIVPLHRAEAVADQLFADGLWSGWGIRTMSRHAAGYGPLAYHNGTVWPHDNSLIAWGLARYGRHGEAREDRAGAARCVDRLRPRPARGVRRPAAIRDAVSGALPDRQPAAGVGGGRADTPPSGRARARARSGACDTHQPQCRPAAVMAGGHAGRRHPGVRDDLAGGRAGRPRRGHEGSSAAREVALRS